MIRLRASIYHIFTGNNSLVTARKMVIPITSLQSKRFQSLQPLHTSNSDDDDDFAELGLPVARAGCVIPKLMTEKREPLLEISDTIKKSHGLYVETDSCLKIKGISTKVGISSPVPSLAIENNNDGRSNFSSSCSVTIKNVPSIVTLLELKEAVSLLGNVSKASKRSVPNGLDCCDIEFKSSESSRKALSVGKITVKNFNLPICPLPSSKTITIRISNINSDAADSAIHSTCTLCGPLEGLLRSKEDVVDALFSVQGEEDTKTILNKLNSTVLDECKWSAQLQHSESPAMAVTENDNSQDDLGIKISGHLAELKREIVLKNICAEDLECLHHSVLHLENHPLKARR
ncbi:hypothetical protein DITRI_Ditri11bG0115400 [Diplodiscus trichospermus]